VPPECLADSASSHWNEGFGHERSISTIRIVEAVLRNRRCIVFDIFLSLSVRRVGNRYEYAERGTEGETAVV
jgi:hypothetical protein